MLRLVAALRKRLFVRVKVRDRDHVATYVCETPLDAQRPLSLWVKEQGTMAWIDSDVRAGDVFMDIGANIGIYSIAAAMRVGESGIVYAFEPHKVNALSLLRNVQANRLQQRIRVFSCAVSDVEGMLCFNYRSLASASTASQLGHSRVAGTDREFAPIASEMVYGTTVDRLVRDRVVLAPTQVKIDVDGNELMILRGMGELLRGAHRPRSVQIELNVGLHASIPEFMKECGYELAARHFTHKGKEAQGRRLPLASIAHNAIFVPQG